MFHIQPDRVPRPHKRSAEMKKDKVKMSAKRAEAMLKKVRSKRFANYFAIDLGPFDNVTYIDRLDLTIVILYIYMYTCTVVMFVLCCCLLFVLCCCLLFVFVLLLVVCFIVGCCVCFFKDDYYRLCKRNQKNCS